MATLKLNIDSSGAEDGARKLQALMNKLGEQATKLVESHQVMGASLARAMKMAEIGVKQAADKAELAFLKEQEQLEKSIALLERKASGYKRLYETRQKGEFSSQKNLDILGKELQKMQQQEQVAKNIAKFRALSSLAGAQPAKPGFDAAGAQLASTKAYALDSLFQANYSGAGVRNAIKGIGDEAGKAAPKLDLFKRSWIGVASQLGLGLTAVYAVRRGITETIGTISSYEKQLDILNAVTQASVEDQRALADAARSAGTNGMFSATEAASALTELAKAGFSARESISALNGVMNFAINAQVSIAEAADTSAKAIRQFDLDAAQASRVIDALTNVANETTTNVQNLGNALKFVGPAAHSLGIDIETTAASIGILAQRGIDASLAGTGLRRIFTELASPSDEARKRLQAMGVAIEKLNPATNKLTDIMRTLRDANMSLSSARVIFDQRTAVGALVLADYADELEDLIELERTHGGIAQKNAEIISDNLAGAWTKLGNTMKELSLETGDNGLLGVMRANVDNLNDAILFLTGNWRKIRLPDTSEATYQLRDLADSMYDSGESFTESTDALEKFKSKLVSVNEVLKGAKDTDVFKLDTLRALDIFDASSATTTANQIEKAYAEAIKIAKAKIEIQGGIFDEESWQKTSGLKKLEDSGFIKADAVKAVEAMIASLQQALDKAKPIEVKKPQRIDFSSFEDIYDEGVAKQSETIRRATDALAEQRAALEDGTAALRAQNTVRRLENQLYEDELRIKKELKKAEQELQEANIGRKIEIVVMREWLELLLAGNLAKKEALDNYKKEAEAFEVEKEIKAANKQYAAQIQDTDIQQKAYVKDLQAELAALKVAPHLRQKLIRLANEHTDAEREYLETIKLIHANDPYADEKFEKAKKHMEDRVKINEEFIKSISKEQQIAGLAESMSESFGSAAEDILLANEKIMDSVEDMVRDIQRQFLHELFTKPFSSALYSLFQNMLGGLFGGGFHNIGGPGAGISYGSGSAYGATFGGGSDIISSLSKIPTDRGMQAVGEQTPEAIMPLGRGNDGRLGVRMIGGDMPESDVRQTTVVNRTINMTVNAKDADSFKRTGKQIASDMKRKM